MRSPTFTARYVTTVPASVRCTPSTRMSLTTNGSMASAGSAAARTQVNAMRRSFAKALEPVTRERIKGSAREQAVEVVVEGEENKARKKAEAQPVTHIQRFF